MAMNGSTKTLVTWLLGILGSLIVLVIAGGAAASIATRVEVRGISIEQSTMQVDITELKQDVKEVDRKLDAHLQVRPGGGGGF